MNEIQEMEQVIKSRQDFITLYLLFGKMNSDSLSLSLSLIIEETFQGYPHALFRFFPVLFPVTDSQGYNSRSKYLAAGIYRHSHKAFDKEVT